MKLFLVENYDDFNAIIQASLDAFGTNTMAAYLIGGYRAENGTWFAEDRPLYPVIAPKNTNSDRCMRGGQTGASVNFGNINCLNTANAFCEFTKTARVNRVAKTTICRNLTTIQDSSLNYVKSACIIDVSIRFHESRAICRLNGMSLFRIKTAEDFNAIKTFAANSFATQESYYVEGSLANGRWMVGSVPLFTGAVPSTVTGSCLVFRTNDTIAASCGGSFRPLCEFV
jgi:hypothetical protein